MSLPDPADYEFAFVPAAMGIWQLEVFEASIKDGRDLNKAIIPVEWQ